ncbi:hypothetical protein PINS_up013670 [Pythium insidiosum]|nr:hypothetical protein PINS_up013670 [Pythium insidiosum]
MCFHQPKKRASVDKLLSATWLQRHNAIDGTRCARRIAEWLQGREAGTISEAKHTKDEDDDEIEEEIEANGEDAKDAK